MLIKALFKKYWVGQLVLLSLFLLTLHSVCYAQDENLFSFTNVDSQINQQAIPDSNTPDHSVFVPKNNGLSITSPEDKSVYIPTNQGIPIAKNNIIAEPKQMNEQGSSVDAGTGQLTQPSHGAHPMKTEGIHKLNGSFSLVVVQHPTYVYSHKKLSHEASMKAKKVLYTFLNTMLFYPQQSVFLTNSPEMAMKASKDKYAYVWQKWYKDHSLISISPTSKMSASNSLPNLVYHVHMVTPDVEKLYQTYSYSIPRTSSMKFDEYLKKLREQIIKDYSGNSPPYTEDDFDVDMANVANENALTNVDVSQFYSPIKNAYQIPWRVWINSNSSMNEKNQFTRLLNPKVLMQLKLKAVNLISQTKDLSLDFDIKNRSPYLLSNLLLNVSYQNNDKTIYTQEIHLSGSIYPQQTIRYHLTNQDGLAPPKEGWNFVKLSVSQLKSKSEPDSDT